MTTGMMERMIRSGRMTPMEQIPTPDLRPPLTQVSQETTQLATAAERTAPAGGVLGSPVSRAEVSEDDGTRDAHEAEKGRARLARGQERGRREEHGDRESAHQICSRIEPHAIF